MDDEFTIFSYTTTPQPNKQQTAEGKVIGMVGAPGVGKEYIIKALTDYYPYLQPLPKIVTKTSLSDDRKERIKSVTPEEFHSLEGIIGEHRPFHNGVIHAWQAAGAQEGIKNGIHYITDAHIGWLDDFRRAFGDNFYAVGLIADAQYRERNLLNEIIQARGGEEYVENNDLAALWTAMDNGFNYDKYITRAHLQGELQTLITVDSSNRDHIAEIVKTALREDHILQEGNFLQPERNAFSSFEGSVRGGVERR